jgi:hypothetical protein
MSDLNSGATVSIKGARAGPLASHIDGFAARLASQGYMPGSVQEKCDRATDLSRWLDDADSDEAAPSFREDRAPLFRDDVAPSGTGPFRH